ncbi:hypothetical protein BGX28_005873 [Mortierella sp. GBA30]|nr:hypothetical protein BGX28_005873 [Mortierella sp. GBA30]
MAAHTLILFCLISGEPASNAFPVKIPSDESVGILKDAAVAKKPSAFAHIDTNDLVLWHVTIPLVAGNIQKAAFLNEIFRKTELIPPPHTDEISEVFKKKTLPKKSVHITVERPKARASHGRQTPRQQPSRGLRKAIYAVYPDREDVDAVFAIIHPRGASRLEDGGTEYPSDDAHVRDIIQQSRRTNARTLIVALETPTKKYTDFTLKEVNSLYGISNMETPDMSDLKPLYGISTEALDSDLHKKSIRRLLDELEARIQAMPSNTLSNKATCSAYTSSWQVDYAVESLAKDGTRHILGVTEVKHKDYRKGLAKNLVQLESSLIIRKRKRNTDDDGDEEQEEDKSVPLRAYGLITCFILVLREMQFRPIVTVWGPAQVQDIEAG